MNDQNLQGTPPLFTLSLTLFTIDSLYSKKGAYEKNLEMSHLIEGKIGINEERHDSMDFSQPLVPGEKKVLSFIFSSY